MTRRSDPEIEIRWRIFDRTLREIRAAFADVEPDELQKMIDEAVAEVRAERYRRRG